jgi:HD-GYP domain-containing protein (c-di-GMP phosphodiesterase class II)
MAVEYKKIEDISKIDIAYYITDNTKRNENITKYLSNELVIDLKIIDDVSEIEGPIIDEKIDVFFIDQKIHDDNSTGLRFCNYLRENGYKGIIILCVDEPIDEVSNYLVTSIGFDNFLPINSNLKTIRNQIHWAVLNRRRKNKNILQFDNNPDALYTVDKDGIVYDINKTATTGCRYSPKEIVTNKINIRDVGTLPTFDEHIRPLIIKENIGNIFEHTSDEEGDDVTMSQIKVNISSMPMIGLVAAVFKTNITKVMFTRTLDILTNSVALLSHRDNYTAGHSSRVFYYCMNIVNKMNLTLDKKFTKNLYCAALLHDIGKIGVKDQILLKPGKLSIDEFKELSSHPLKGCNMLERYKFLKDCIDLIKFHHERPDGKGYPEKLTGKDIPLGAAIIAVADSFDAMTSNRPYRDSLDYNKAVKEVELYAGEQFDYDIARVFLSIISPELVRKIREESEKPLEVIAREILAFLKIAK